MGFDSHIVYILYGICIPTEEMTIKVEKERKNQRRFKVDNYYLLDYGRCWYLALKSTPLGLGENDVYPVQPYIIQPPSEDDILTFKTYLINNDLNYDYHQYFLTH